MRPKRTKSAQAHRGMDALQLRNRLSNSVARTLLKAGHSYEDVARVMDEMMTLVDPLVHGKMPVAGGVYQDIPDARRKGLEEAAKDYLRSQAGGNWKMVEEASGLIDVISSYGKHESKERGGSTSIMMLLGDLVRSFESLTVDLKEIPPNTEISSAKGKIPIGPGYYELVATGVNKKDGESTSKSLLDIKLGNADPDEIGGRFNDAIGKFYSTQNSRGGWLRTLLSNPLEWAQGPSEKKVTSYKSHFSLGAELIGSAIDSLTEAYREIGKLASSQTMPQVSSIFDGLIPELKQSQRAMQKASMGMETLDLTAFDSEVKKAAIVVPERGRNMRDLLIDASAALQSLKQNLASKVAEPSSSKDDNKELKLLKWEVTLAMGVASRGIEAIKRLLANNDYWLVVKNEIP